MSSTVHALHLVIQNASRNMTSHQALHSSWAAPNAKR